MILSIVQARLRSTRLSEKALLPLAGKPSVVRVMERVASAEIHKLFPVVASVPVGDTALIECIEDWNCLLHTGPEKDLVKRLLDTADWFHADAIVRITGDCPLISPCTIKQLVGRFQAVGGCHYASNVHPCTYPDGLDVEIYSTDLLRFLYLKTRDDEDAAEDFSTFFWKYYLDQVPSVFMMNSSDLSALRWTLDDEQDLEFIRWVYEMLGDTFETRDVLRLLKQNPQRILLGEGYNAFPEF